MTALTLGGALGIRRGWRRSTAAEATGADDVVPAATTASGSADLAAGGQDVDRRRSMRDAAARLPSSRDVVTVVWNLDGLTRR